MLTATGKQTRSVSTTRLHCSVDHLRVYRGTVGRYAASRLVRDKRQQPAPLDVILVFDYNPELHRGLAEQLPDVRVVPNNNGRGLSGARNAGVALATGDIVAFLRDIAIPQITRRRRGGSAVKNRQGNQGCQPSPVAPDTPVPVLMYHSVSDAPRRLRTSAFRSSGHVCRTTSVLAATGVHRADIRRTGPTSSNGTAIAGAPDRAHIRRWLRGSH